MVERRFGLIVFSLWWDLESRERLELSLEEAREEAGVGGFTTGRY
jgi:hypothetical protein